VISEALASLHNLIKQDAHADNEIRKQRQQRHLQKFANAAYTRFAERAPFRDQSRLLPKVNNEAKVRRSTESVVLGKAHVMSYDDLMEARAKRAAKDAAKAEGKGKTWSEAQEFCARGRCARVGEGQSGADERSARIMALFFSLDWV
jgi:arginine utilization protein RocB